MYMALFIVLDLYIYYLPYENDDPVHRKKMRFTTHEKKVTQRHQMVSGSLALLYFLLGFHRGGAGQKP